MEYFDRFPAYRQWPLEERAVHLPHVPLIAHDTPVMNLGSCFGEYLQLFLDMYHFNALEPQAGYKYSCHSILREIDNAHANRLTSREQLFFGTSGYTDLNHHRVYDQDIDACRAKINAIERNVREALSRTEVIILTPSLIEVWKNRRTDEFILHPYPGVLCESTDLEVHFLTVAENIAYLESTRDLLLRFNPRMQIIVGVCPTPLRVTYRDEDAVQGNNASKFTLYAAVNEFCRRHDNVHYFPGYDIVFSELAGSRHYMEDNRHLAHPAVRHYLRRFGQMFCSEPSQRIMALLERLAICPPAEADACLEELGALGYPADLLHMKTASVRLRGGDGKGAFDSLCRVSMLQESPALNLNLGLLLREMGFSAKAATFFGRALDLLHDIPGLSLTMADRAQRIRLGDNHMKACCNIFDTRRDVLTRMRETARALLRGAPGAQLPPLRGLLFADVPAQPPFPIGMGAHAAMPEAPPARTGMPTDCLAGSC
ncbi:GSCFA domain-containing protein [Nitratidesulfovibrio sp. SRB-5]|uniref:GSCFA domain-containing protein n=1 Tax=Nitratidesulfovibrio sp. SRB-5 TaxID=2872636 RepID=UPI001024ADE0|nr:GSCFA domain-containing protein [Nitratidesulfovibrio sp. SRB-5]MBZ2171985.1 GSCFA domain-containing protein [Nitratidesulfovibrio sp. SRB-5]RXF78537.1 hypothetical protein EKK70_00685 [Desulfovibrio sp. DS-1]